MGFRGRGFFQLTQNMHNRFFCVVTLVVFSFFAPAYLQAQPAGKKVIAYYSGALEDIDHFDATKLTHIIYCFGHLKGNNIHLGSKNDTLMVQKMVGLKAGNPQLKVLVSLGGWGGCAACSDVFSSAQGRSDFARSVRELNAYLGADGIDLDWEYPAIEGYPGHTFRPEDKANFTALLEELRRALGDQQVISFAAGGFADYVDHAIDWDAVMQIADFVNLMTYDLVNGYSTQTGHHTALYSTGKQKESVDNCVQMLLRKGVDPHKLIVGAAFYARTWENVAETDHGLYQQGKFRSFIGFKNFGKQLSTGKGGFVEYWDKKAKAPFAYNAAQKIFATYDNPRSIKAKMKYIRKHHLGGIMFWELSLDTYSGGLLDTIDKSH